MTTITYNYEHPPQSYQITLTEKETNFLKLYLKRIEAKNIYDRKYKNGTVDFFWYHQNGVQYFLNNNVIGIFSRYFEIYKNDNDSTVKFSSNYTEKQIDGISATICLVIMESISLP